MISRGGGVRRVTVRWRSTEATRWATAGLLLSLAASLVLLLAPLSTQEEATSVRPGSSSEVAEPTVTHPSMLETEGWDVVLPLSAPVLLTGGGLVAAWRGIRGVLVTAAILLGAFVVLGALSIGSFYAPAEVAVIVAAVKLHR